MTPFQMGLMPVRIPYRGKTTPTENPMREFATCMPVSPIGHMRVTLTGNQALCSYMDPDTQLLGAIPRGGKRGSWL